MSQIKTRLKHTSLITLVASLGLAAASPLMGQTSSELESRVAELRAQLAAAEADLHAAQVDEGISTSSSVEATAATEVEAAPPPAKKIEIGPFAIGGAIRANYVIGDYASGDGPTRGGDGGNMMLDTFRINVDFAYDNYLGKVEYRWYNGYNFLHTGWVGYDFDDAGQVEVGVNRVPFGPGAYGVSNSWFFDQHYYLGFADDMDLGIKYSFTPIENLDVDVAYYAASEGSWNGASMDSARYSYDVVRNENGIGYEEQNTFNVRAIYHMQELAIPTDLGVSLQWGQLNAKNTDINGDYHDFDDGNSYAASVHMVNSLYGFTVKSQLTAYEFDVDENSPDGRDLVNMGAFDYAYPVAAKGWVPSVAVSRFIETPRIAWLDSVTPYVEYSSIRKDADGQNSSDMWVIGAAWARGGWYIYTDWAYSNGNYFVGGDDFTNFGVNADNDWQGRLNVNFGYYF